MTISFKCPKCGKRLKAGVARAGRLAACPRCSEMVTIPEAEAPPAVAADRPQSTAERKKPASEHPLLLVKPVKAHDHDLIDMTAMVDIVFFLLIFFMVTSMQSLEAVIGLPTPQAQASSSVSVADFANDPNYVTVTIDEDDAVWLDDVQIFGAQDLRTRLRAEKKKDDLLTGMLVVGSPEASHGTFVMVLDAGADAGITELMFSVQEEIDEPLAGG